MMSYSRWKGVESVVKWWCEGKIRNRRAETGWAALYEGWLDKARMDRLDVSQFPRNPAAAFLVMHPWLMLRSFS